jgi:toxoflavin synthase
MTEKKRNGDTDCSSGGSMAAKLYADIAVDYNATKSNPFKRYVEESTFASALCPSGVSSLSGQHVLDLGCGAGHYCRILKTEWNAKAVRGVDVSEHMLAEAKRQEEVSLLGIQYLHQDLLSPSAAETIAASFGAPNQADLVTAQYLLPYAANKDELDQLCATAAALVKPGGGRFVSIVSMCSDSIISAGKEGHLESNDLGWAATWEGEAHDGMCVELTLFGEARASRVSFPNFLWTRESIEAALSSAGFGKIEWSPFVVDKGAPESVRRSSFDINKTPMGVFVASMI